MMGLKKVHLFGSCVGQQVGAGGAFRAKDAAVTCTRIGVHIAEPRMLASWGEILVVVGAGALL